MTDKHLEWVLFAINTILRIVMTAWTLSPERLHLADSDRREAYEQFSAHSVRQMLVTWPLLAAVGVLALAAKSQKSIDPTASIVFLCGVLMISFLALAVPHDSLRTRGRPYAVMGALIVLDSMLASFLWAKFVTLLSSSK